MNHAYKLVWNAVQNIWVVASELAKGNKKTKAKTISIAVVLAGGLLGSPLVWSSPTVALPTGESVAGGSATFDRSVSNQLTINQSSNKLITNWSSFNIGSGGKVNFVQPSATSIALNRITGAATEVFGQLSANGQLILVNPSGITFGAGSQVNAAALTASVFTISDARFNNGLYRYVRGTSNATVENNGSLTATAGDVSILAPVIKNNGSIKATAGNVNLINATDVTLSNTLAPVINQASIKVGLIKESGSLQASKVSTAGGRILLIGDTSQSTSSIELAGALLADDATTVTGKTLNVTDHLSTTANTTLTAADNIHINAVLDVGNNKTLNLNYGSDAGETYSLSKNATVNLTGATAGFSVNGAAYTLVHDVNQLQAIGTDYSSLMGKYVIANDIDASITSTWNSGEGFAPIGGNGNSFTGVLDGLGHSIDALFINRPGSQNVGLIGAAENNLIQNIGLSNINVTGGDYVGGLIGSSYASYGSSSRVINNHVSGSVTGMNVYVGGLIGSNNAYYGGINTVAGNSTAGSVTGYGYTVGGLIGDNYTYADNSVSLITDSYSSAQVTGASNNASAGGLVGNNQSAFGSSASIHNSHASGNVLVVSGNYAGGLVGRSFATNAGSVNTVSISNSYATGDVTSGGYYVGGLVGQNYASGSSSDGVGGIATISNSYATGSVTGNVGNQLLGGLVGSNYSDNKGLAGINNTYATGSVTDTVSNSSVGGLAAENYALFDGTSSISNSYASGLVTGQMYYTAGLVVSNLAVATANSIATVENSYWDSDTTGQSTGVLSSFGSGLSSVLNVLPVSGNGGTEPSAYLAGSYASFDFSNTWFIAEGRSRPMLRVFLNTADSQGNIAVTNLYQLQGMAANLAGHYILSKDIDASATLASVNAGQNGNYSDVWGGKGFASVGSDPCSCSGDVVFKGSLDGAGHTISGLNIDRPAESYIGLFGTAENATLQNLNLTDAVIVGGYSVGGLVGGLQAVDGGQFSIKNSSVSGVVDGSVQVGGLVGSAFTIGGTFKIDSSHAAGDVNGNLIVGGLIGANTVAEANSLSLITDSDSSANVTGDQMVGGLIGLNLVGMTDGEPVGTTTPTSIISDSHNSGTVTAEIDGGGLIGLNQVQGPDTTTRIEQSYNAGLVTNGGADGESHGGLIGENVLEGTNANNQIIDSYNTGNVTSGFDVGGLIGTNRMEGGDNSATLIEGSYNTGNISAGQFGDAGGLLGFNFLQDGVDSNILVQNSYNTGNVLAGRDGGGLIGYNLIVAGTFSLKNTYNSGEVAGGDTGGGLIGYNVTGEATNLVSQSYATGLVREALPNDFIAVGCGSPGDDCGPARLGGLIGASIDGQDNTFVSNSFWNVDSTEQVNAIGESLGVIETNLVGLSTAQMTDINSYASWGSDIDAQGGTGSVWRIYDGYSAPLLRSFLKSVTATVGNEGKTYDGTHYTVAGSYTLSDPAAILLGTAGFGGTAQGARNAGTYDIDLLGLYSDQQGYDLTVQQGSLNIAKANLTVSSENVVKTYDGSTEAAGYATANNLFDTDSVSGGTFAFDNKNAGSGKTVSVANVTVNDGNGGNNYNVSYVNNTSSTINKAALALQNSAVNRVYNGTTSASSTISIAAGTLFGSDNFTGGKFEFLNKNVGTNKQLVMTENIVLNDGNNGNNYLVAFLPSLSNSITPAALTLQAIASSKVYDGTIASAGAPVVTGRKAGDSISGLAQVFADKNAGSGKTINIKSGFVINDGNGGNNYIVTTQSSNAGVITPASLTLSAVANTKVFDGSISSTGAPTISGLVAGDLVSGLAQEFGDKNAGTAKTLNIKLGYVINDGNSGNNYVVSTVANQAGVITPKLLTLTAVANSKAYDGGVTSANKPTTSGLVSGDRVTSLFQQYETKTIGTGKRLLVKAGYVVDDGNGGNNYSVVTEDNHQGVIY